MREGGIGTSRRSTALWNDVKKEFLTLPGAQIRTPASMRSKYDRLNTVCSEFMSCYTQAARLRESGGNHAKVVEDAQLYWMQRKNAGFCIIPNFTKIRPKHRSLYFRFPSCFFAKCFSFSVTGSEMVFTKWV